MADCPPGAAQRGPALSTGLRAPRSSRARSIAAVLASSSAICSARVAASRAEAASCALRRASCSAWSFISRRRQQSRSVASPGLWLAVQALAHGRGLRRPGPHQKERCPPVLRLGCRPARRLQLLEALVDHLCVALRLLVQRLALILLRPFLKAGGGTEIRARRLRSRRSTETERGRESGWVGPSAPGGRRRRRRAAPPGLGR